MRRRESQVGKKTGFQGPSPLNVVEVGVVGMQRDKSPCQIILRGPDSGMRDGADSGPLEPLDCRHHHAKLTLAQTIGGAIRIRSLARFA